MIEVRIKWLQELFHMVNKPLENNIEMKITDLIIIVWDQALVT